MMLYPKLQLKNFNPTPEFSKLLKRSLERLADLSPSDSYIKTVVEEKAGSYQCEISVASEQRKWSVLKAGTKPIEALTEAMASVLSDLTSWKKNRFK